MSEFINTSGSYADRILAFYFNLKPSFRLPEEVETLQPYGNPEVQKVVTAFYSRYYQDNKPRIYLLGINPGRHGGGITGIPFTDPVRLQQAGFDHTFQLKPELSSEFIYKVINAYGGLESFTKDFFLTAICPIGFTRLGKNFNYYDSGELEAAARPWIVASMKEQLQAGANRSVAVCLGEGSNYKYLQALNEDQKWFGRLIALPHPRWIMQYNRKKLDHFILTYVETLRSINSNEN